ncbi:30S ribosomal protein S8 [Tuwongella immobilis]|uniref:Small ribosomal subunit protein uS8 n=1 Tax=Tuwongella immobilis TaxID=692036 RepID=A0A6C2YN40_9BACT|nr:30S ribosomal protein S8 [Tuwongella immobilis]VIP02701.1 30s ribosomal protein s8 : 30S ribosomal protein S8 OS=Planctomyces maris DSM 8797 GN=rpsH PE=3 SV=1: Ribosomal_S8 [Tuwongella immobilis]VTS02192.1 30s ribosomal protein s8 : 30S ribosomal protein S8 OS=Planctomyces maris DSM 8797 GN=rpsH PE=3 SV=1: Ribosomal_S8 [Tuwongella immobilis]
MMTDPIADMLTRIRNANHIERRLVEMPAAGLKVSIAQVLQDEGFITGYVLGTYVESAEGNDFQPIEKLSDAAKPVLRIFLKYGPDGEKVIRNIERASKPGRRLYRGRQSLPRVLDGLGIAVISTSKGVMSDRKARKEGVGGELICTVW